MDDEIASMDAVGLAELIARGDVKPSELVEAAISRVERLNPTLNAVISPQFERAREEAESADLPPGPLRGVPFLLKDLGAHLANDPVYNGMRVLKELDWRESSESEFAGRLRRAGCVVLGRTNSPELGLAPTTEPESFGPSRNPWNLEHTPGGSSGGSAAAVAAGFVPAAHASDGGGSIRIPAAHCGLVGLKPTRARTSFGPNIGERWAGFSSEGFVTRSVRDTAAFLDVVSGNVLGDPYTAPPKGRPFAAEVGVDPGRLRIGVLAAAPGNGTTDPECADAAREAATLLESLGHIVDESSPDALQDAEAGVGFVTVLAAATAFALDSVGERIGRALGPEDVEGITWAVAEIGRKISAPEYVATLHRNHLHSRRVLSWWESGYDLLLTPTCAAPPPPLGHFDSASGNPLEGFAKAAPYSVMTSPYNVTGQPAISLPLHWSEAGLPIGVQLVAATGREDVLLRVAAQLEEAQPWIDRRPPVYAD